MADDTVFIFNPTKGANILPSVGLLKPGWNEVARKAYAEARVTWKDLPYTVRDPAKRQGPKELTADEASAMALETNDLKLLKKLREGEKRKSVLEAIDHQEKVLTIEKQNAISLKAMLDFEDRPQVRDIIEKAIKVARSDS